LLFLYREVLGVGLPWLSGLNRHVQKRRITSLLTREEVASLFQFMDGKMAILVKLLYGTDLRLLISWPVEVFRFIWFNLVAMAWCRDTKTGNIDGQAAGHTFERRGTAGAGAGDQ
jgi:hypothetical protein